MVGHGKWRDTLNAPCRTWDMARKLTNKENE